MSKLTKLERENKALRAEVAGLTKLVKELMEENKSLRARLSKDSSNSDKPPSSDGLSKKPVNLRVISKKKPGGQGGHRGTNLKMVSDPDSIIAHKADNCSCCGAALSLDKAVYDARQVFDLPELKMEVTEHRSYTQLCGQCCHTQTTGFPAHLSSKTQYGNNLKTLCVYLNNYQFLPYHRLKEFIGDFTGHRISTGSIANFNRQCYEHLACFEQDLRTVLLQQKVLHVDETGMRKGGKTNWVHVISTRLLSYFVLHPSRGDKAVEFINILPKYKGTLIHDRLSSYFKYGKAHGLCNAHLLRNLKFVEQAYDQRWAKELSRLLVMAKNQKQQGKLSSNSAQKRIYNRYIKIIRPERIKMARKHSGKGRRKRDENERLLDALELHKNEALRFVTDPLVPFDNNQAERDLRMIKVKQKVSGCFRSDIGASTFCRIRSYIATARKLNLNILQQIHLAIVNRPFIPSMIAAE